MSFIDWGVPGQYAQMEGQQTQNANSQLDLVNKNRALNALRGVNLSDQGSVGNAMNGLARLGMADRANALMGLSNQRAITTQSVPLTVNALGAANDAVTTQRQASGQSSQQQPDLNAQHQQILKQGADATQDLLNTPDTAARAQKAAAYKQQFSQMGLPQQNIDEVLGDLSDQGLQQHHAYLAAAATGDDSVPHPTGYAASKALLNSDPMYRNAEGTLTGPMANPIVQAALKQYAGLDLGPPMQQALEETNPGRQQAATAAFAPTTSEVSARGSAIGAGSVGTPPAPGARLTFDSNGQPDAWILPNGTTQAIQSAATAQSSGTSAGSAPYQAVTVPTGVPGQTKTESAAQFAGSPPAVSASAAQTAGAQGGAESNTAQANAFEQYTGGYPARKANLENLRTAAAQIPTGPQAPFWGHLGALAAEYGIHLPIGPNATGTANFEEVRKVAAAVLAQQKDTLGLPNTNQSVTLATGATPGEETSPLGIQRLAGLLEGNEDYGNAARQAWDKWKTMPGNGRENFQDFVPQWNKMFDPRVFQAQYFDPAERAIVAKQVPNFAVQERVAKRLGYIAGQ